MRVAIRAGLQSGRLQETALRDPNLLGQAGDVRGTADRSVRCGDRTAYCKDLVRNAAVGLPASRQRPPGVIRTARLSRRCPFGLRRHATFEDSCNRGSDQMHGKRMTEALGADALMAVRVADALEIRGRMGLVHRTPEANNVPAASWRGTSLTYQISCNRLYPLPHIVRIFRARTPNNNSVKTLAIMRLMCSL